MCLQDVQLARSLQQTEIVLSGASGATELLLQADSARVGFFLLGPNADNIELFFGGSAATQFAGVINLTDPASQRMFSITSHGLIVTGEIYVRLTVARSMRVITYVLPPDYETLQYLAAYGKYGK